MPRSFTCARLALSGLLTAAAPALATDPAAGAVGPRPGPDPAELGADDLTDVLEPIRREHGLPALVAVVVDDERVVAAGAVGVRRAGGTERVGLDDRFHLGSCTKSMTAMICARLVEEEKLRWNQTVRETLPVLAARARAEYRAVTLAQLLGHRSGLPDDRRPDALRVRLRMLRGDMRAQRRSAVALALAQEPAATPGTAYVYSNMGFVVAGVMAEQATGRTWEQLARDLIFQPLDMTTAGFGPPGDPDTVDHPWGHQMTSGSLHAIPPGPLADVPPVLGPALTVHCSMLDWAKYARLLLTASRREEDVPTYGWNVASPAWARGEVLRHGGSNGRWHARITIAPDRTLALLVATNRDSAAGVGAAHAELVRRFAVRNAHP